MDRRIIPSLMALAGFALALPTICAETNDGHAHDHVPLKQRSKSKDAQPSADAKVLQGRVDRVADALALRTDHYWHQGDFESVAFLMEQVVALDPKDVQTWGTLGWLYWSALNDEKKAEATLRAGLALNRDRHDLYHELGTYLMRRKRYGEAAATLAKGVKFPDAHVLTWNSYAHSLERMGRPQQAAEVWRDMEKRFPNNPHTQVNLARMKRKELIK